MSNEGTVTVKLTRAVVIDGNIVRAGKKVELAEGEAKVFLNLGKAELAAQPVAPAPANNAAAAQAAAEAVAKPAAPAPAPAAPAAPAATPAAAVNTSGR